MSGNSGLSTIGRESKQLRKPAKKPRELPFEHALSHGSTPRSEQRQSSKLETSIRSSRQRNFPKRHAAAFREGGIERSRAWLDDIIIHGQANNFATTSNLLSRKF